jgi:hypothetical protein
MTLTIKIQREYMKIQREDIRDIMSRWPTAQVGE